MSCDSPESPKVPRRFGFAERNHEVPNLGLNPQQRSRFNGLATDMGVGAFLGGFVGAVLPGLLVPLIGFAAAPITMPVGLLCGAYAGVYCHHETRKANQSSPKV
jgi:predicted lipid-binding transport protein (Tim44 family)